MQRRAKNVISSNAPAREFNYNTNSRYQRNSRCNPCIPIYAPSISLRIFTQWWPTNGDRMKGHAKKIQKGGRGGGGMEKWKRCPCDRAPPTLSFCFNCCDSETVRDRAGERGGGGKSWNACYTGPNKSHKLSSQVWVGAGLERNYNRGPRGNTSTVHIPPFSSRVQTRTT